VSGADAAGVSLAQEALTGGLTGKHPRPRGAGRRA